MVSNFLNLRNPSVVYAALVVLVLILTPSLGAQSGATYYVATTGNDNNSGAIGSPWLTVSPSPFFSPANTSVESSVIPPNT